MALKSQDKAHNHLDFAVAEREKIACQFDKENSSALDCTKGNLGKIFAFHLFAFCKGCVLETGVRSEVFALSKSSLDLLVSALQMARQRAPLETAALLRIALEAIS